MSQSLTAQLDFLRLHCHTRESGSAWRFAKGAPSVINGLLQASVALISYQCKPKSCYFFLCFALLFGVFVLFFVFSFCGSASKTFWLAFQTTAQTQMFWEGWLTVSHTAKWKVTARLSPKKVWRERGLVAGWHKVKWLEDTTSVAGMTSWNSCGVKVPCCFCNAAAFYFLLTSACLYLVVSFVQENTSKMIIM